MELGHQTMRSMSQQKKKSGSRYTAMEGGKKKRPQLAIYRG